MKKQQQQYLVTTPSGGHHYAVCLFEYLTPDIQHL